MSDTPSAPDGTHHAPMSMARLRALCEAYGASPERWPSDERELAVALLAQSQEARALQASAAGMDALLDVAAAPQPSADLVRRVLAGAPTTRRPPRYTLSGRKMAFAAFLAAAAAVLVWLLPRGERTGREPTEQYAIRYEGVYTMPTDVLLVPPGLDLLRTAPIVGCVEKGLGCSVVDTKLEKQSRLPGERVDV